MKKSIMKMCLALSVTAGLAAFALAPHEAEANSAQLVCEGIVDGYLCDAYPMSGQNTYYWSASGGVYLPAAPPNSSSRQVRCKVGARSGHVSVLITYPDGTQDTVGHNLTCGSLY